MYDPVPCIKFVLNKYGSLIETAEPGNVEEMPSNGRGKQSHEPSTQRFPAHQSQAISHPTEGNPCFPLEKNNSVGLCCLGFISYPF